MLKKILLLASATLCISTPAMADLDDEFREGHLVRGTTICNSKSDIDNFLDIKDRGRIVNIKGCYKLKNRRTVEIDKRYPLKGYTKVEMPDGRKVYVDRDAVIR